MQEVTGITVFFVVATVLLFVLLGIAILVIVDHKARIPGQFHNDPFSISGLRREHPGIAFLTTVILFSVIIVLLFEMTVTLGEHFGLFAEEEKPALLKTLHQQRYSERMRHFHNTLPEDLPNMGKKPVCFYCHGDFPHSKQRMIRTLLNMHTQFVGCITCHADPRKIDEDKLHFRWLNYSGIAVNGPPFGTSLDPETGNLVDTDDYYSKIVTYEVEDGEATLLEIPETSTHAKEFLQIRDQLSDIDREAVKKSFHKLVSPKGRFCSRCHAPENEGYLPFRELGFSEQRIESLTNLNIIGIVQKYREFYMPNLFIGDKSLPDVNILLGPDHSEAINGVDEKTMRDDPRAWWRKTFEKPGAKDNDKNKTGNK